MSRNNIMGKPNKKVLLKRQQKMNEQLQKLEDEKIINEVIKNGYYEMKPEEYVYKECCKCDYPVEKVLTSLESMIDIKKYRCNACNMKQELNDRFIRLGILTKEKEMILCHDNDKLFLVFQNIVDEGKDEDKIEWKDIEHLIKREQPIIENTKKQENKIDFTKPTEIVFCEKDIYGRYIYKIKDEQTGEFKNIDDLNKL